MDPLETFWFTTKSGGIYTLKTRAHVWAKPGEPPLQRVGDITTTVTEPGVSELQEQYCSWEDLPETGQPFIFRVVADNALRTTSPVAILNHTVILTNPRHGWDHQSHRVDPTQYADIEHLFGEDG